MKHRIISLLCCIAFAAMAEASNQLIIHFTSGAEQRYVLVDDEPVISFVGDSIVVTTATTESRYDMTKVSYFNYETTTATSIASVGDDGNGISVDGNHIAISGVPAGSAVNVYDITGKSYIKMKADEQGRCNISLDSLTPGVYIVSAYKISTKITKK